MQYFNLTEVICHNGLNWITLEGCSVENRPFDFWSLSIERRLIYLLKGPR